MSGSFQNSRNRRVSFSLLILLLCLGVTKGFLYSILIPPWQAPDEPGHLEYARLLSEKWRPLTREDISSSLRREILVSLREFHFWEYLRQPELDRVSDSFSDDLFSVYWGTQVGDESPLYYLLPAFVFSFTGVEDVVLQLYIMRWFSVLLSSLVVAMAYLTAQELFPDDRFLVIAVPIFVAFLPMFTFIGASANNDSLAALAVSLLIWQLARILRRGLSWHSGLAICTLAFFSVFAKKTAVFTIPLVIVALLIHLWGRHVAIREAHKCASGVFCVLAMLLLGIISTWRGGDAVGWIERPRPWMDTRSDAVARFGGNSLHIVDDTRHVDRRLVQSLSFNVTRKLRDRTVTFAGWVRSGGGEKQRGCLLVADDERRSLHVFSATQAWSSQGVTHTVSPTATAVRVVLSAGGCEKEGMGDLYFDDVSLVESGREGPNLLTNGSGEAAALRVWSRFESFFSPDRSILGRLARHFSCARLVDAQSYDPSLLARYVLHVFLMLPGFWANFGWLTVSLDMIWYEILALASFVALIGLCLGTIKAVMAWRRGEGKPSLWRCKGLTLFSVAVCLIILQALLPMIGRDWQPQGRYLFPAIIPIATLFGLGWREVVPGQCRQYLIFPWTAAFLALDALCIFGYVIPYFRG